MHRQFHITSLTLFNLTMVQRLSLRRQVHFLCFPHSSLNRWFLGGNVYFFVHLILDYSPPSFFFHFFHFFFFMQRMGNIDDAVPFFGKGFNKIYPLIMVIYTILIGSNFFDRLVKYFGNWKIFNFLREEADDLDGFDQSGIIILQRGW